MSHRSKSLPLVNSFIYSPISSFCLPSSPPSPPRPHQRAQHTHTLSLSQVAGTLLYIQSRAPPATADEEAPINATTKSLNTHAAASGDGL